MPIRFTCEHCGQKLSVGSQKAGTKANCPRCKESVRVPGLSMTTERVAAQSMLVVAGEPANDVDDEPAAPPVEMQFFSYSDQPVETSELVFDTTSPRVRTEHSDKPITPPSAVDYELVSIPRRVIYLQAGLLVAVAVVCFTLGALMGGAVLRGVPDEQLASKPCVISGFVQVIDGVMKKGDAGAVVIVLPQDRQEIDERAAADGLRPRDSLPPETHRGLGILRTNGAGFAKADANGKYQVSVPRQGKYFLLVISRAKIGGEGEIDSLDLRKIARFFENANELIGQQKYRFSEERFVADRKLDVSFE